MITYIVLLLIISFTLMNNCSNVFGGRTSFDGYSFLSTSVQDRSRPRGSLEVMHKYGHRSKLGLNGSRIEPPSLEEILERDQNRVLAIYNIHQAFTPEKSNNIDDEIGESKAATIPAKSGAPLGTTNYVVSVGLGTPAKDVTLEFDTGSSLTWTQCKPCIICHPQKDPMFDPSSSTSFTTLTCNSDQCSQLNNTVGGTLTICTQHSDCIYATGYEDLSITTGILGNEVLTLTPNDVFSNFTFGCAIVSVGTDKNVFGATAGILGLGQDSFSVVSQTAGKYGKYFSYCLPTRESGSIGHLTFGKDNGTPPGNLAFTPLVSGPNRQSYYVNIESISVGGTQLPISPSVFQSGPGTIIDSGTLITRLPLTAYTALRDAFKQQMLAYTLLAQGVGILDTCYDFSKSGGAPQNPPAISFIFEGNVKVDVDSKGILIEKGPSGSSISCLAFAAINKNIGNTGIFGNWQQQTIEIAYDVAGGRLGFAPNGCS